MKAVMPLHSVVDEERMRPAGDFFLVRVSGSLYLSLKPKSKTLV